MADVNFNEVLNILFRDIIKSRMIADKFSLDVADSYKNDEKLKYFTVPRLNIRDIEIELKFKVTKIDTTDNNQEVIKSLRDTFRDKYLYKIIFTFYKKFIELLGDIQRLNNTNNIAVENIKGIYVFLNENINKDKTEIEKSIKKEKNTFFTDIPNKLEEISNNEILKGNDIKKFLKIKDLQFFNEIITKAIYKGKDFEDNFTKLGLLWTELENIKKTAKNDAQKVYTSFYSNNIYEFDKLETLFIDFDVKDSSNITTLKFKIDIDEMSIVQEEK
ncbi:MAG: hypothetical protein A2086_00240 [Spirochaetes bacterium GWD1_27_9]|nr:MAG: hypothetical protein A2Z98_00335 [Spirochaetes bacterium GWB1_27_13]OHD27888.1 MAG: hypothetical protein A2Y34_14595 [Spirochaetes bacterium GWC1_27_15]OHD32661.1 MAG: hypothetical protein A2086_00240 [Spirochaetes bacterium GWD1_27_9]